MNNAAMLDAPPVTCPYTTQRPSKRKMCMNLAIITTEVKRTKRLVLNQKLFWFVHTKLSYLHDVSSWGSSVEVPSAQTPTRMLTFIEPLCATFTLRVSLFKPKQGLEFKNALAESDNKSVVCLPLTHVYFLWITGNKPRSGETGFVFDVALQTVSAKVINLDVLPMFSFQGHQFSATNCCISSATCQEPPDRTLHPKLKSFSLLFGFPCKRHGEASIWSPSKIHCERKREIELKAWHPRVHPGTRTNILPKDWNNSQNPQDCSWRTHSWHPWSFLWVKICKCTYVRSMSLFLSWYGPWMTKQCDTRTTEQFGCLIVVHSVGPKLRRLRLKGSELSATTVAFLTSWCSDPEGPLLVVLCSYWNGLWNASAPETAMNADTAVLQASWVRKKAFRVLKGYIHFLKCEDLSLARKFSKGLGKTLLQMAKKIFCQKPAAFVSFSFLFLFGGGGSARVNPQSANDLFRFCPWNAVYTFICNWAFVGQARSTHFALCMCTFSMWFKLGALPALVFPASYKAPNSMWFDMRTGRWETVTLAELTRLT